MSEIFKYCDQCKNLISSEEMCEVMDMNSGSTKLWCQNCTKTEVNKPGIQKCSAEKQRNH